MNKRIAILLSIILLLTAGCVPPPAQAGSNQKDLRILKLNANMVRSSQDIENAIHTVTEHGTLSGTVELDGSAGAFLFTEQGDDRSISIEYSNVKIIGVNKPFISNAYDCFVFKNQPLSNIEIKGISMICDNHGINADGNYTTVAVDGNSFRAGVVGIGINQGNSWTITNNSISSDGHGIDVFTSSNIAIENNNIDAIIAVEMQGTSNSKINTNNIGPAEVGIVLQDNLDNIQIVHNAMGGIRNAGIFLMRGNTNYHMDANKVSCKVNFVCQVMIVNP